MKKLRTLILISFSLFNYHSVFASAPVVDESENYANNQLQNAPADDMQALAHDDNQTSYFGDSSNSKSTSQGSENNKLLNEIQDLQQTVQELRGQIDTQKHTIDTLKEQQLTLYKDLDARITSLQAQPAAKQQIAEPQEEDISPANDKPQVSKAPQAPIAEQKTSQNPADEQISYMAAYHFIEKKQFSKAQLALQEFIQNYPNSGYTPNAEYWLGELFLQQKDYSRAQAHFENVINNYPSSNKAAASMYKMGVSLAGNGQDNEARARFNEVMQKFPDSDAAKLAANQLKVL
ncbi:MAG TPA: tol-pal system protein YbgF [Legionellales bacterium]|nr:tol-pal system protein YbgF [Legionellales bacterium]